MHTVLVAIVALLIAFPIDVPTANSAHLVNQSTTSADTLDVWLSTPEAVIEALYNVINRRPGEHFDWDKLRSLFVPGALMVPSSNQTGGVLQLLSVEDFIALVDRNTVVGGENDWGFQEEEIARRIEHYGDIVQVFSAYQKRFWGADEILALGINAIQLRQHDGRWWVVSIAWEEEVAAGPLPAWGTSAESQPLMAVLFTPGSAWDSSIPPYQQPGFDGHSQNLIRLREAGHLVAGGRYGSWGLILVQAADEDEARELFASDPTITNDVFNVEMYPWMTIFSGEVR